MKEFLQGLAFHYAPAWRVKQIIIDVITAVFAVVFLLPMAWLFAKALWLAVLQ